MERIIMWFPSEYLQKDSIYNLIPLQYNYILKQVSYLRIVSLIFKHLFLIVFNISIIVTLKLVITITIYSSF